MTDHAVSVLARSSLFEPLDDAERRELAALLRPFELAADEVLFRQGTPADRMDFLTAGRLAVHRTDGEATVPLTVAEPGTALGEPALAAATLHTGTAIALGPASGLFLETGDFTVMRKLGQPLAHKVLERLERMTERPLDDGEVVFAAHTPGDALHVVAEGTVEVRARRDDRRVRLAVLGPGKVFGEVALVDDGPRSATCTALGAGCVLELDRQAFASLAEDHSPLSLRLLEALVANLVAALERLDRSR